MSCKDPGLIHSIDPCQVRNHCHDGEFGKRLDPVKDEAELVIGALSGSYWIPNSALCSQDMLGMKCSLVTVDETA